MLSNYLKGYLIEDVPKDINEMRQQFNRIICESCKLAYFADYKGNVESMLKLFCRECGGQEEEIPESTLKRLLSSNNNIYWNIDNEKH